MIIAILSDTLCIGAIITIEHSSQNLTHYYHQYLINSHIISLKRRQYLSSLGIFEAVHAKSNRIHAIVNGDDIPYFKQTISDENGKWVDFQIDEQVDRQMN